MTMFNRVIPNWETIQKFKQPLTEGEMTLVKYLDEHLPRDNNFIETQKLHEYNGWLIFVQPFLNGSRPDIVIFHPKVGVQIFEVKDWNLDNYTYDRNDKGKWDFYVTDSKGTYLIKPPTKQVEYYKEKLIGQLVPQIGEEIDKDYRKYGLIKTSIYFHKSTTSQAQKLFENLEIDFAKYPIFGSDKLTKENLKQVVPDSYLPQSHFWKKEWNDKILFWLYPPFHSLEQTIPLTLNKDQRKFSEPHPGHFRVRGVAGSGKTQGLAYRAGKLASQGFSVLILSFNITLWHYIRDMIQRSPFKFCWDKFTFNHFHGFCKDILNQFDEKWPTEYGDDEEVFKTIVPKKVLEVIQRGYYEKYDAILIDEGQDYCIEWYQMLRKFLTERNELVIVCDEKQNIYGRNNSWITRYREDMKQFGNWIELKTIVRLPEKIANIAKEFSELFKLNQDVKVANIERPDLFNQYVEHIVWENIVENEWLSKVNEAYETIKSNATSKHDSDTVILLPDKNYGFKCVRFFETEKKIKVNHVFEDDSEKRYHRHKKAFWMGDGRLKISTIHSFKGWEALNVIIFIPESFWGGLELNDRKVYTAMTRTIQNLIVLNSNKRYWDFGEKLPKRWK